MQARNLIKRISKILGKVVLGLLVLLFLVIATIHLPPVQALITRKLSGYLSSKTEAKVDIERIRFSLLGNVGIDNLSVKDPDNNKIVSAREITVSVPVLDLIKGDLIFDDIRLAGVDGTLVQTENGLNIQFILDAFRPAQKMDTTQSAPVKILFRNILLEDILFEFNSAVNGTSVAVNLGTFTFTGGEFSTKPTAIKAEKLLLQQTIVDVLTTHRADTFSIAGNAKQHHLLLPDFGTHINLEIGDIQFKDNQVSFHRDQVIETQKFDPNHITVKNIQLVLSDIKMHEDLLAAELNALSAQLPGFVLTRAQAGISVNPDALTFTNLQLASGTNELRAALMLPNDLTSANKTGEVRADIKLQVVPSDLEYFLPDSILNQFRHWGPSVLTVEAFYSMGEGEIKSFNLETGNSEFHASGKVSDVFDLDSITWNDVEVNATFGSDFRQIVTPFLQSITLPPTVNLQLKSSGNRKEMMADARLSSVWGNVMANGRMKEMSNNHTFDATVTSEQVDLGKWMASSSLGPVDMTVKTSGNIGDELTASASGVINKIEILDQQINQIIFQGSVLKDSAVVAISVTDPNYKSELDSRISFEGQLSLTNHIQFDKFMLGKLLHADSTLTISGDTRSRIVLGDNSIEGFLDGRKMFFHKQLYEFSLDSMIMHALLSPSRSEFTYFTDFATINLESNFDLREAGDVIRKQTDALLNTAAAAHPLGTRSARFDLKLEDTSIFKLVGIDVDDFDYLKASGEFNEQQQQTMLQASTGKFSGYGVSLDSLHSSLSLVRDSIITSLSAANLYYDSIKLGKLDFNILTNGDTAVSNLVVAGDTITLLDLRARIVRVDSGRLFYPDKLLVFDHDYYMDPDKAVYLGKNQLAFDHFTISRDSMEINLNGNHNAFDVSFRNLDLALLNFLVSTDTVVITKGLLSGKVSYTQGQQLNLRAAVDSLMLYNSSPMSIDANAVSEGDHVPFEFRLTNTTNEINLKGTYFSANTEIDASLLLDVNNPELFTFLASGVIEEWHGSIQGEAAIHGPLQKPSIKGFIGFRDMGLTLTNPRLKFYVENDRITLDNSSLLFNRFTLYDQEHNPLTIDGNISYLDYEYLTYNLKINSDQFTLFNNPDSTQGQLRGKLVIDSDIVMKGDAKDLPTGQSGKTIDARLTVKDATQLTVVTANDDINLLKAEGIVEFVDPALLMDSSALMPTVDFYDSLINTLPDFTVKATVVIEDNATLKVVIDEQSGDNLEISGGAKLELGYDRTGNLTLDGDYTVTKGIYRLSFYDLVKKNFQLVPGSSVTWNGNPKNGDLNIKAIHSVESNSIGLIGHEIGENEKSIYKRSLDYQVGININGTIESPVISFSLDLPQNEKKNYPVLANKLDRLRQPEYESELNKQVFGLLVLGGFIPETSGSDINSSAIVNTALANSVNSLLASQLNRFTSQYIKGVNIDVGIQSYSDYSAPGGKTQTAMDFRVSKSMMNDRLSFQIGGDFNISQDQSGANTGTKNYRGDIAIIYDLTGNNDKQLKLFNNETYDIVYQEIRNTGISLIFIRDFDSKQKKKRKDK
jgi:hypothetical protein